jgi:DnaJ-domain-containing protein 1
MTDYFALLGELRRPVIDLEPLKARALALAAESHPDRLRGASEGERRAAEERFAQVTAAMRCLADPKERLQHLLELERGRPATGVQPVPPELADLFLTVGAALRSADQLTRERAEAQSPMLKARWMQRALAEADELRAVRDRVRADQDAALLNLAGLDKAWTAQATGGASSVEPLPLTELEGVCAALSYTGKWVAQLQERELALTL